MSLDTIPTLDHPAPTADAAADAPATEQGLELLTRLTALAVSPLPDDRRLAVLAALEGAIDTALAGLEGVYAGAPTPLREAALRALNLARQLALAASDGFRKVARAAPSAATAAPLLVSAAWFASHAIGASYRAKARVPTGAWKHLHVLYLIAEALGVHRVPSERRGQLSVARIHRDALLVALADPYRLEPGQLLAVERVVAAQGLELALVAEAPSMPTGRHFLVPCGEDAPPRPLRRDASAPAPKHARYLDTNRWVEALQGAAAEGLPRKVLAAWDAPTRRASARDPGDGSVAICVGVQPIAYFVAHEAKVDARVEERGLREGITIPLPAMPQDEGGRLLPIHEWELVDLGSGGLCARRRAATAYPVTVGEVIGIRAPGKAQWTVGVTRWVMTDADGGTQFGVQFFAQGVCPVWARNDATPGERQLAVLVAEREDDDAESLLAPPGTYSSAGEFELRGPDYRARVRRGMLVEANDRFELFRIVPA